MLIHHAQPTKTACPVYACTLPVEDHGREDKHGQTWHYDETTDVHRPTGGHEPVDARAEDS